MSKPIRNIETLNRRLKELKNAQKELELKLDTNFQSLRSNYLGMTLNSVFGSKKKSSSNFWADIVTRFMESEKLQNGVSKLAETLADKVGDGIHKAFGNDK